MTNNEAIEQLKSDSCFECSCGGDSAFDCEVLECTYKQAITTAIKALKAFEKLDVIITKQIDISTNQVECQTLRWVLDKMSELEVGE